MKQEPKPKRQMAVSGMQIVYHPSCTSNRSTMVWKQRSALDQTGRDGSNENDRDEKEGLTTWRHLPLKK